MSNGIDNIYDTSDVRRRLYELGQQRQDIIAEKDQRRKDVIKTGTNLLDMWKTEQSGKLQELLALKDPEGLNVFEMDPERLQDPFLKRFFTTAEGKVSPVQVSRTETQMVPPKTPGAGSPEFIPKEVTITEPRAKDFLAANPELQGPKTMGGQISQGAKELSETSKKFFKTDFGKLLSVAGVVKGLHDIGTEEFKKRSEGKKGLGYLKTGLGALSLFVPGAGIWAAGASLADIFDF